MSASAHLAAVPGQPELVEFTYGFALAGKSLPNGIVTELDDGDLLIEGWAADFAGLDRQNENFSDGAFTAGIKAFLAGGAPLCYHHKHDVCLGKVLELREVEGKGLYLRARVDRQLPSSPLHWIYSAVRKGSMRGLSVGGFFKRKFTDLGRRIIAVDLSEISITPVPVHPGTGFAVVAGKALEDHLPSIGEGNTGHDVRARLRGIEERAASEALTRAQLSALKARAWAATA